MLMLCFFINHNYILSKTKTPTKVQVEKQALVLGRFNVIFEFQFIVDCRVIGYIDFFFFLINFIFMERVHSLGTLKLLNIKNILHLQGLKPT